MDALLIVLLRMDGAVSTMHWGDLFVSLLQIIQLNLLHLLAPSAVMVFFNHHPNNVMTEIITMVMDVLLIVLPNHSLHVLMPRIRFQYAANFIFLQFVGMEHLILSLKNVMMVIL